MPYLPINETGTIGMLFKAATENTTGSAYLTGIIIVLSLIFMALAFRLPIELIAIFLIPLVIVMMAFQPSYYGLAAAVLIYLGLLFAKHFIGGIFR